MSRHSPFDGSEEFSRKQAHESAADTASVIDLLGDTFARNILATLKAEPKTARELVATCDGSRPTVYRRLNALEETDLVTARNRIDPDGHHRKEFTTHVRSIVFNLEPEDFETALLRENEKGKS
jgi:DNA-binding transcriptional ArsR family regulator